MICIHCGEKIPYGETTCPLCGEQTEFEERYQYIPSFNWIIPKRPRTIFRMIELVTRQLTKPFAILYNNFVAKNKFKKERK